MAQYARLNADWLIPMPSSLTSWEAMALGTAGYTAALSVLRLQALGADPAQGEVLVTGATGGVGSIAIMLLVQQGFKVIGATGKTDQRPYLNRLGAADTLDRATLSDIGKPLQKERWATAVDTAGSHTLANVCAQMQYEGIVAACGLAQGMDFPATVAPFILRGVTLAGIDSVMASFEARKSAWDFLANKVDRYLLSEIAQTIRLEETLSVAKAMIAGKTVGRVVVNVNT